MTAVRKANFQSFFRGKQGTAAIIIYILIYSGIKYLKRTVFLQSRKKAFVNRRRKEKFIFRGL